MSPLDDDDTRALVPTTPAGIARVRAPQRRFVDADVLAVRMGRVAFALGFVLGPLVLGALHATGAAHANHVLPYLGAAWATALLGRFGVAALARPVLLRGAGRTDDELLRASLVLPTIALALVGPLTLHAPFALLVSGTQGLDAWTMVSAGLVGHAHVVLAVLAARRVLRLVAGERALTPGRIYWIVVAVAAVPGVVYLGLPPILTALTGLAALPLLLGVENVLLAERARLSR